MKRVLAVFWILCAACGSDHASYDGPPQERVILDTDTTALDARLTDHVRSTRSAPVKRSAP